MDKEDKMRKTITKVVLIICAVSVALGIALCASGVVTVSYTHLVMDFDGDRFPFFKVFAGVCVTRHIITAVKAASRKKHLPLNSYVSLDKNTYDDDSDTTLLDIIAFSELQDPEAILIDRENMDGMEYKINKRCV